MIIRGAYWKSLSQKGKFDLLLLMSNLNVLGEQVKVVSEQKNKSSK